VTARIRGLTLAAVALLAACAPQGTPETSDAQSAPALDAGLVRGQVDAFVSAWNSGDLESVGSMLAEDVVLMQPDGPPLEGRDAVLNMMSGGYDTALFQQSATVDEILDLGDYAYARGTWTLNPTPAAGEIEPLSGKWSAVYAAGPDGGWQTWRWMWNQPSGQGVVPE